MSFPELPPVPVETTDGRAAFQVLVLPYRQVGGTFEYALFRRSDAAYWQGVAGGGDPTIPVVHVTDAFTWGPDVLVIPEYTFGVQVPNRSGEIVLSHEHTEVSWFDLDAATRAVRWDSNRTALWELDYRLRHGAARPAV